MSERTPKRKASLAGETGVEEEKEVKEILEDGETT